MRFCNAWFAFLVLALTLTVSCKKKTPSDGINGNPSDSNYNQPIDTTHFFEYSILPSATDLAINSYNNGHEVMFDTSLVPKNKLFVFLPGTTGTPFYYRLIVTKAAKMGYHAIGLMYPNSSDLYTAAGTNPDLTAFGKGRKEIFQGTDEVTGISVNATNCIKNRLLKLLVYLDYHYPNQHWGQYFTNNNINWSKCVIAGHSQGGGEAFYIAKQVNVAKAISFSSIDWNSLLNQSAAWVTEPGATPISCFYSFNAVRDQIFSYANVETQLNEMGLSGSPVSIDNALSPYGNTHRLTTNASPATAVLFPDHNITCLDSYVPKDNAGSVIANFEMAWEYLLSN
jgi:hypothetical protein